MRLFIRTRARLSLLAPLALTALTVFTACARPATAEANEHLLTADTNLAAQHSSPSHGNSQPVSLNRTSSALAASPRRLASLSVYPSKLTLRAGEPTRLSVAPFDQNGDPIAGADIKWSASATAGSFDAEGRFVPSTTAGTHSNGATATVSYGGVTQTMTVPLEITAGPLAEALLVPETLSMFTGDTVRLAVDATDRFGNAVSLTDVQWGPTDGEVSAQNGVLSYHAGRTPGLKTLQATVTDDSGAAVTASMAVLVREGKCATTTERARWNVRWFAADPTQGTLGALLSEETLDAIPGADWGVGPVAGGMADHVHMVATAQVFASGREPVAIALGGDDGFRVRIDGEEVPGLRHWKVGRYEDRSARVMLEPGAHQIQVEYFEWAGAARFNFSVEGDALQWERLGACQGGYSSAPESGRWVSAEPVEALAARFGMPAESFGAYSLSGQAVNAPRATGAPRKVIVLQGLTTNSGCDTSYDTPEISDDELGSDGVLVRTAGGWRVTDDGFALRAEEIMSAVNGASGLDADDFIQFSYSGQYRDCGNSDALIPTAAHPGNDVAAVYSSGDTCQGVVPAAARLRELITRLDELEPGVQIDIVGHSMGGMTAAYLMSQEPELARRSVRAVVTLESPLLGFPVAPMCGMTGPAVDDILAHSDVVPAIKSLAGTDLAKRITSVAATAIGSAVPGEPLLEVGCAQSEETWSAVGGSIFGQVGEAIAGEIGKVNDAWHGHGCTWHDPETLGIVASVIAG